MLNYRNIGARIARRLISAAGKVCHRGPLADTAPLADQLRQRLASLRLDPSTIAHQTWRELCDELIMESQRSDPEKFLCWSIIQYTMFVSQAPYLDLEFAYLRKHRCWPSLWKSACIETRVGSSPAYWRYPWTSGNSIHQLYHLCRFMDITEMTFSDLDYVFEFGGGYGNLCRLIFSLGFSGHYCIFDLPVLSALQQFYLSAVGLLSPESRSDSRQVILTADHHEANLLLQQATQSKSLFVATWSLSETPLRLRAAIEANFTRFGGILIGYQCLFGDIDNSAYFEGVKSRLAPTHECVSMDIGHMPNNRYLFCRRLDRPSSKAADQTAAAT